MGRIHAIASCCAKGNKADQRTYISCHGAQGNIACNRYKPDKDHSTDQKHSPVKGKEHSGRSCNSLSPSEFQIDGEIMSKDTACCRIHSKQGQNIPVLIFENRVHHQNGDHAF